MEKSVLLTILSVQTMEETEETRLVTDGILRVTDDALELSYAESELTGLVGTTTTFRIEPEKVTLQRSGKVQSKMVFTVGKEDQSLYDMGFGALMITIRTDRIENDLTENGGKLTVAYDISIEDEVTGSIEYQIDVRLK